MGANPPSGAVNPDGRSELYDSLQITPLTKGDTYHPAMPAFHIGAIDDNNIQISVFDGNAIVKQDKTADAFDMTRSSGGKMGFQHLPFNYDQQIFNTTYQTKFVNLAPYSSLKIHNHIVKTTSVAKFTAKFTMQTTNLGVKQLMIPGEVSSNEYKFVTIAAPSRGCCECDPSFCSIF